MSLLIICLLGLLLASPKQQPKTVSLEIISEDGKTEEITIEWPFNGPPPVGSNAALMEKVDSLLKDNKVDCPPKRVKVSDHIWKCGNGKKIRTNSRKLVRLFNEAWNDDE